MSLETVTFWSTLLQHAREVGDAEKSGDSERFRLAKEKLEAYKEQCLKSDRMALPITRGEL